MKTIKLLAAASLEGVQGILETKKAPSLACLGQEGSKKASGRRAGAGGESRISGQGQHGQEKKAQEAGPSSYYLPSPVRQS